MTQDAEQRIENLEIKLAFQEQLISDLNDELVQHGTLITQLEQQMTRLIEHIRTAQEDAADTDDVPPHY